MILELGLVVKPEFVRVLMQIVQELCKRPGLNRTGFDMPTIYLADLITKVCC